MSSPLVSKFVRLPTRVLLWALVATTAVALSLVFGTASLKQQIILLVAIGGFALVALSPHRTAILLCGWILLLTYNRQYFSFDSLYGNFESQGLYWIPADAALLALAGLWAFETVRNRDSIEFPTRSLAAIVPFLAIAALSMLSAVHLAWGFAEWLRWVKAGLAVIVLSNVLRGRIWWFCLVGLGLAVVAQSGLGFLQVMLNTSTGLLSMFSGGGSESETVVATLSGTSRSRASGTMVHPNILGPYLLFILPIFLALSLGTHDPRVRWPAVVVCLAGFIGVAGTMSRLPVTVSIVQAGMVVFALVLTGRMSPKRLVGLASIAGVAVLAVAAYFLDDIYERVTGDLEESFEFRGAYNRVALDIWREYPLFGIGLNNFNEGLADRDPKLATIVDEMQQGRQEFGIRAAAPVHNLYLLVLAETGVLGLLAFVFLLYAALRNGIRASVQTRGALQLVGIGVTAGIIGQYLQQTMDFSMWMDPGLFTFVLLMCLVQTALRGKTTEEPFAVSRAFSSNAPSREPLRPAMEGRGS